MTAKEQQIEAAVAAGEIPGLILLATDTAGMLIKRVTYHSILIP